MRGEPFSYWGKLDVPWYYRKNMEQKYTNDHEESKKVIRDHATWHPFLHHCDDVAACMERVLEIESHAKLMRNFFGSNTSFYSRILLVRLSVLAFLHDLGKGCSSFQFMPFHHYTEPKSGHSEEGVGLLFRFNQDLTETPPFFKEMKNWFSFRGAPDSTETAQYMLRLMMASFSHHGKPLTFLQAQENQEKFVIEPWQDVRYARTDKFLQDIERHLRLYYPEAFEVRDPIDILDDRFDKWFAGIVTLVDFLGSNVSFFPYSEQLDIDRLSFARGAADAIVTAAGMDISRSRKHLRVTKPKLLSAFGFTDLNPVQEKVATDIPLPSDNEPSRIVIESNTGTGKTETAMIWAFRLIQAGLADGIYFALPTRTSAIQLHKRLTRMTQSMFGAENAPPVVLAVPGYLRYDDQEGWKSKGDNWAVRWNDDDRSGRGWAAENSKRYLSAPISVGTFDQVMMSTIKSKHAYMRQASVRNKVIIVDEAHASDLYMRKLMSSVLRDHERLGGHSVIMSATLGTSALSDVLKDGYGDVTLAKAKRRAFPSLLYKKGEDVIDYGKISKDNVGLKRRHAIETRRIMQSPIEAAELAVQAARQGAKVLVIRNTVGLANATLDHILDHPDGRELLFSVNGVPTLHHGRFCPVDRKILDEQVEVFLGKEADRGRGGILIGTQTLEMSLDIDADFMITDLCPIDVLLQRLGRLHRHDRSNRPEGFTSPRCVVMVPDMGVMVAGESKFGGYGLGRAYKDIVSIELTRELVDRYKVIQIPENNRELVELATHPEAQRQLLENDARWKALHEAYLANLQNELMSANGAILDPDMVFGDYSYGDMEQYAKSRIGAGNVTVELHAELIGPFGNRIKEITAPYWMVEDVLNEEEKEKGKLKLENAESIEFIYGQAIIFSLQDKQFIYSHKGLELLNDQNFAIYQGIVAP